jgi:DNA-binding beta-propeller fold protein YncE
MKNWGDRFVGAGGGFLLIIITCALAGGCGQEGDLTLGQPAEPTVNTGFPAGKTANQPGDLPVGSEGTLSPASKTTSTASAIDSGIPSIAPPHGDTDRWRIENALRKPARIAKVPGRDILYVTDPTAGSLFRLDTNGLLLGELKGLGRPLGVAVGADSRIYVGDDEQNQILSYRPDGSQLSTLASGLVEMPNDLTVTADQFLVVADSRADAVLLLDLEGRLELRIDGAEWDEGALRFPAAVTTSSTSAGLEIYIADQGNGRIVVSNLEGALLRVIGGPAEAFDHKWEGLFTRPQSLAVDTQGRLHVLDSYQHKVQILNCQSGTFIAAYGEFGTGTGQLNTPLGFILTEAGAWITNSGSGRLDLVGMEQGVPTS